MRRSAPPQRAPAPPPQAAPAPVQRSQPDVARQSVPAAPVPPVNRGIPRQASSPWGGMLGGALIGLGLGSLIGANSRDQAQQPPVQSEGGNGDEAAAGTTTDPAKAGTGSQLAPAGQPQNRFGSILLIGLLALVIYFVVRRSRRKRGY
jgi:hypothetical protein